MTHIPLALCQGESLLIAASRGLRLCQAARHAAGVCQTRAQVLPSHRHRLVATAAKGSNEPCSSSSSSAGSSTRHRQQKPKDEWTLDVAAGTGRPWQRPDLRLVLVHPQIPQNTGNVSRTCAATNVPLHLVGPMGFEIDNRRLKRAGLDYWPHLGVVTHDSWQAFLEHVAAQPGRHRLIAYSKFGRRSYAEEGLLTAPGPETNTASTSSRKPPSSSSSGEDAQERQGGGSASSSGSAGVTHWLLFGAETTGLPPEAHDAADAVVKIPMSQRFVRSLNLASSVAVGLYEAIRQLDGPVLPEEEEEEEEEAAEGSDAATAGGLPPPPADGHFPKSKGWSKAEAALVAAGRC